MWIYLIILLYKCDKTLIYYLTSVNSVFDYVTGVNKNLCIYLGNIIYQLIDLYILPYQCEYTLIFDLWVWLNMNILPYKCE